MDINGRPDLKNLFLNTNGYEKSKNPLKMQ
jgi:hypothetical protein